MMNDRKLIVSAVQMECLVKDKERNLAKALGFLEEFRNKVDVDIVCFPELFTTGYNLDMIGNDFHDLAETIPGKTTSIMSQKAMECNVAILGTIVEKDERGNLYDTTFVIDETAGLIGKYRKSHLHPSEYPYFESGNELAVFELARVRIGVAICFEHAFPQIFTTLALLGAKIVFIPSAVPMGYEYLVNLRTRARAQDNQLFVVAVNRVGQEGDVKYCGSSKVVDPRGDIVAEAPPNKEEVLIAELDLGLIQKEREQEPVLTCLRPELYPHGSRVR
ncbi:MAG: carbon-nitrogen hydrolase family protein [Candidatus Geothermarchaeales archaeon]